MSFDWSIIRQNQLGGAYCIRNHFWIIKFLKRVSWKTQMRFGKLKPFLLLQIVDSQVIKVIFFLGKLNVLDKRMPKWSCNSLNLGRAKITGISSTICSQYTLSLDYRGCWENCKDSVYCYRNRTRSKLSMGFYWIFYWFWRAWTTMRQWNSWAFEVSHKFRVILRYYQFSCTKISVFVDEPAFSSVRTIQ